MPFRTPSFHLRSSHTSEHVVIQVIVYDCLQCPALSRAMTVMVTHAKGYTARLGGARLRLLKPTHGCGRCNGAAEQHSLVSPQDAGRDDLDSDCATGCNTVPARSTHVCYRHGRWGRRARAIMPGRRSSIMGSCFMHESWELGGPSTSHSTSRLLDGCEQQPDIDAAKRCVRWPCARAGKARFSSAASAMSCWALALHTPSVRHFVLRSSRPPTSSWSSNELEYG